MATPVGHYLLGLSIAQAFAKDETERKRAFWLGNVGWLPDLDFLPGFLLGDVGLFHRGATHSLLGAVVFAIVAVLVLRMLKWRMSARLFLALCLIFASHSVLDFFGQDSVPPSGVSLLWPWTREVFQSPWLIFPDAPHTIASLISLHTLVLLIQETLVLAPLNGLIFVVKGWPHPRPKTAAWLYGGWFLLATAVSILAMREGWL
ncbi:MAG: metal-dependent hydrolase [Dehalococcoidia bacterium]